MHLSQQPEYERNPMTIVNGGSTPADPAKGETLDPRQPTDPATVDPAKSAPLGRWPWIVTAILAAVMLVFFFNYIDRAWDYVIGRDETAEKEDWDQLSTLVGRVDALVTVVLGAILGAGLGAAKGAGDAKVAAAAADSNKKEAERQHATATINAHMAASNRDAARTVHQDLRKAKSSLRKVQTLSQAVATPAGSGIRAQAIGGSPLGRGQDPVDQSTQHVTPGLSAAIREAGHLCDVLDQKYG